MAAAQPLPQARPHPVAGEVIDEIAGLLRNGKRTAILMRGRELTGSGLEAAGRVAAKSGARLLCDLFSPHTNWVPGAWR